jgi:hypothetical protein
MGLPAIHCAQFTAHNIIHHEKIKIPLDEFLILLDAKRLLDFRYMSARLREMTARF